MQNKGILISDAHVKSRLWTNFPQIQGDSYRALEKIKEAAKGSFIISCGDLFDSNRPSSTDLECVSNLMRSVEKFYYISGNHDDCVPAVIPSLGTNAVHLYQSPQLINGVPVFGIDYCNSKDLLIEGLTEVASEMLKLDPSVRPVLVLHQKLDVFFMKDPTITLQEIRDILTHPCDIFIGDIHIRQLKVSDEGFCLSPGPLVPQDIGQAKHQQGATYVDFSSGTHVELKDIPVKVRDYTFLDSPEELEGAFKRALEADSDMLPPVIVVKVDPSYKLPKEYKSNAVIVLLDTITEKLQKKAVEKATVSSLEEAVKSEIMETEKELSEVMVPLLIKLMHSEVPDEVLLGLLDKWEIVMT